MIFDGVADQPAIFRLLLSRNHLRQWFAESWRVGQILAPKERIPIEQALCPAHRAEPTRVLKKIAKRTLEPGKLADFIVVDRDVVAMPPGRTEGCEGTPDVRQRQKSVRPACAQRRSVTNEADLVDLVHCRKPVPFVAVAEDVKGRPRTIAPQWRFRPYCGQVFRNPIREGLPTIRQESRPRRWNAAVSPKINLIVLLDSP